MYMTQINVGDWLIEEKDLIYVFRAFIPYRNKYGLSLGFEKFFEEHTKFCLNSGLDAIETILLHDWKSKRFYANGRRNRYVKREHTDTEWQAKLEEYNYQCAYCKKQLNNLSKDHVVPISKGGNDKIDNIVPACLPCNRSKRAKEVKQWLLTRCGDV